ncbi:hypothetical protein SETIT_7G026900v2 [Setaria italica]|uniref:ATP-dependent DNA helicase n=1 Tax=Setaria italica TaxID=4555 RepID=A0A368RT54_SETIT|nr:hypothetical protein SETIT_7G026900v2 [Setaria italica]
MASNLADPFDVVYKELPKKHHALRNVKNCKFCNAKKFPGEGPSFCCRQGKVHIYIPKVPHELRYLICGVHLFTGLGTVKNVQEYTNELNTSIGVDQRRYNAPAMDQVAAICIVIHGKRNDAHYIRAYHGCYDPLAYPLFFLGGETGPRQWVSAREYKCYKLQIREGQFNVFFHAEHLFQQLLVDWYVKVESMHLDWYLKPVHQVLIRADFYQGLLDTLATGDANASKVGLRIVLRGYGKLDYFVTMTCNPYWDEIVAELLPGQMPQDRPDVVARVYHAKLLDLHDFLMKKGHLGTVAAWAHSGSKLKSPDDYDKYISAEIPNPNKYPWLHELVVKHMMHGPCGTLNKNCLCMVDGQCHFWYPRQFSETTEQGKDTYPIYRRREDGFVAASSQLNIFTNTYIKAMIKLRSLLMKKEMRWVINEIKQYRDARMITAIEAVYRLFGFKLYLMWPPVLQMQVHVPGFHMVAYKATDNLQDVVDLAKSQRSMLIEYFKMNEQSAKTRKCLYKEFPEYFTWNKGATSFDSLKIWRGITYDTFRAVLEAMGFVDTDKSLDDYLTECAMCANIRHLWDKHYESLAEDFRRTNDNNTIVEQLVLRDISFHLKFMGKDIRHYGLPEPHDSDELRTRDHYRELTEEQNLNCEEEHLVIIDTLNAEQRAGFAEICDHVMKGKGQTYLYKVLLAKVRSLDLIAIATATSSIAASIMPGGRTTHSRFKIPIKLDDSTMCSFTKQSGTAELLRRASLIIWDEVAMTKRQCVKVLDKSLHDIMDCTQPFGGKVLPIVAHGTRAQITDATLLGSYIWESVRRIQLTQNMRAQFDTCFADYLLRIGNGTEETFGDEYVLLPDNIYIDSPLEDICIDTLIDRVFPDLADNCRSTSYMRKHAILSTRNEHVAAVNALMIDRFLGTKLVYYSFDSAEERRIIIP